MFTDHWKRKSPAGVEVYTRAYENGPIKSRFHCFTADFFLYTFMVSGGISLKPPIDAEDIYDKRMISRVKLTPAGGYIIQWLAKVWNPLIVAFGLCRKKYSYVFLGLALQYLLYTTNGLKSTLLSTFLLIMVFIASHDKGRNFAIYFCLSLCSLLGISILLDFILDQAYLSNLFARRMIITPGLLTTYYIDFFQPIQKRCYRITF